MVCTVRRHRVNHRWHGLFAFVLLATSACSAGSADGNRAPSAAAVDQAVVLDGDQTGEDSVDRAQTPFALLGPEDTPSPAPAQETEPVAEPTATPEPFDTSRPGAGEPVVLGRSNDPVDALHAEILRQLLIELGYDATDPADHQFDAADAYTRLASGELELWASSRYPDDLSAVQEAGPDELARLSPPLLPAGQTTGYLVTKSWVEENGIATIDDINRDPLLANELDITGDGIGDILGCDDDACAGVVAAHIGAGGWTNIELFGDDDGTSFDAFLARAQRNEPAIAYATTPSARVGRAGVGGFSVWLSADTSIQTPDTPNPALFVEQCAQGSQGCRTGLPNADIEITGNAEWVERHPLAIRFLQRVTIELDLVNAGLAEIDAGGGAGLVRETAAAWIESHRTEIDIWTLRALGPDPLPDDEALTAEDQTLAQALQPIFSNSSLGNNAECFAPGIVRALEGAIPIQFNYGITASTISSDTILLVTAAEAFHIAEALIDCGVLDIYEQRIAGQDGVTPENAACAIERLSPLAAQANIAAGFIDGPDAEWVASYGQNETLVELLLCGAEL